MRALLSHEPCEEVHCVVRAPPRETGSGRTAGCPARSDVASHREAKTHTERTGHWNRAGPFSIVVQH